MPSLILASSSPRRAELLRQLTLNFKVVPSMVAEIHHDQLSVREAAQINSYRKARSVAKKYPDALVLGADTLVCLDLTLFGKPASLEDGDQIIESISGSYTNVIGLPLEALAMELQSWAGMPVVFNQSLYPIPPKFDSGSQP